MLETGRLVGAVAAAADAARLAHRVAVIAAVALHGPPEVAARAGDVHAARLAVEIDDAAEATLYKVLDDWFPTATQRSLATVWKGARPMLPDGPPVIGPTHHARVWLNLGHGSSGWALACGSARLLGELIGGRAPSIDARGFSIDRAVRRSSA